MDESLDSRLAGMAARLDRLRELDPPKREAFSSMRTAGRRPGGYIMFGADRHGHRNQPLTEAQLGALEGAMGVALPGDFRAFLERIGTGAGPFYGIDRYQALLRDATPECARPFPTGERGPFFTGDDDDDGLEHGYLPIIERGCGDEVGLVTAGPRRGHVVNIDMGDQWILGPDFLTYYDTWLDRSIDQLSRTPRPTHVYWVL
ncbi:SMI1/KNR4 family protein [Actinosynnema sp. CS-041913]|uniref:SMI1/KNR4 family protein n=1 Tax=Actinosynnema sp. CS-041913 TaxID=3239917 RepID=UPI003D8BD10E